jgi:hypothetical protein
LRNHHVRQSFKNELKIAFFDVHQRFKEKEDVIIFAFAKIIKSNVLIFSLNLFRQDRAEFNQQILNVR